MNEYVTHHIKVYGNCFHHRFMSLQSVLLTRRGKKTIVHSL